MQTICIALGCCVAGLFVAGLGESA